jgi:hypothetical protein
MAVGAVAAIYLALFGLVTPAQRQIPAIAVGVAIDLTITASAAVYLIAVRSGQLSASVLFGVAGTGLAVARWQLAVVPSAVLALWGAFELLVMAVVATRVRRALREARSGAPTSPFELVENVLARLGLPARLAAIAAAELTMIGYLFIGWRRPHADARLFTVHVEKAWSLHAGVLVFLMIVEGAAFHLAISIWSTTAAWILSALSAYTLFWVVGDALALRHGGVRLTDSELHLDLGARWRARLPWLQIDRIERVTGRPARAPGLVDLSIIDATVLLHLRAPVTLRGPFGIRRSATQLALSVDRADRFVALAARLSVDQISEGRPPPVE